MGTGALSFSATISFIIMQTVFLHFVFVHFYYACTFILCVLLFFLGILLLCQFVYILFFCCDKQICGMIHRHVVPMMCVARCVSSSGYPLSVVYTANYVIDNG